jgi:phage terminase large subunit-like protein
MTSNGSSLPGERAVRFISSLKHTKGKWASRPFELLGWQEHEVVRPLFGTLRADGTRQYRTAYIEVPRKNGKSELAAALALYLLVADREQGAEVYGAAADRDQASIVFSIAAQMVRTSPTLSKWLRVIDSTKRIIVQQGVSAGSIFRAIPADAAGSHGFNAHAVVMDEVHVQPNRELWDVLATSQGARAQPVMLGITTAGYDRNSLCWELHEYARQVKEGVIEDESFLPVLYSAAEGDDWKDPRVWIKANPSLGHTVPAEFLERECRRAQEIPAYENTFRRLYLNQWTAQESRWLPMHIWDASAGKVDEKELRGRECYGGLDLASSTDIAAFVLIFPPDDPDGVYQVLPRFWIPRDNMVERSRRDRVPYELWERQGLITATEGSSIDYAFIRREIEKLRLQYRVAEIAFDRWGAVQLTQELEQAGLKPIQMGQGYTSMSPPTKELMRLVVERRLAHGGNPPLRWMADNVMVEQDPAGNIKPSRRKSTQKIDGIVALVMALDRAIRNEASRHRPVILGTA